MSSSPSRSTSAMSTPIATLSSTCLTASSGDFGARTGPATNSRARLSDGVFWLSRALKPGVSLLARFWAMTCWRDDSAFKLVAKPDVAWLVPDLTRELSPQETAPPIQNKR